MSHASQLFRRGIFSLAIAAAPLWPQTPGGTGESFPLASSNGAWSFFSDPRSVYYKGQNEKVYLAYITRQGASRIWSYDYSTGTTDTATVRASTGVDDHNLPALYVRTDGRIMAFYQGHDVNLNVYYRTTVNPENITSWGSERTLSMPSGANVTYANPFRLSAENNKLYLFNRSVGFHPTVLTSTDEGTTWSAAAKFIGGPGARPYIKYATNGVNRIHFAFTDGHPRNESNNSIYYGYYENGSIYRANGTRVKDFSQIPLEPSEAERVYSGATLGKAWIWDVALDSTGRPVIAFTVMPQDSVHYYHYARWNGSAWVVNRMTRAAKWFPQTPTGTTEREPQYSGGLILNPQDPSEVFLSKPANNLTGTFEIERWYTSNLGVSWSSQAITAGSAKNNVRPVVPWPVPGQRNPRRMIFWMSGDYVHYTDYSTAIRYAFLPADPTSAVKGITKIAGKAPRSAPRSPVILFPAPDGVRNALGRQPQKAEAPDPAVKSAVK